MPTYIQLTDEDRAQLLARLEQEGAAELRTTELTWADRMRQEGRAEAVLVLLRDRFGSVPPDVETRVRATSDPAELDALLVHAYRVAQMDELLD